MKDKEILKIDNEEITVYLSQEEVEKNEELEQEKLTSQKNNMFENKKTEEGEINEWFFWKVKKNF